ncbi:MAG: YihY/virulence factor BrkB family protein [Candidatus Eremiobacteraeota bacterium]|nr:YihY/virulence factor BrkB family protein [Candidatus Eremiobacteraeota bacterium]
MTLHFNAGLLKETFGRWNEDKAPRLAAALSYTTIFAMAPIFIIVIAIAGWALGIAGGGGGNGLEDKLLESVRGSAGTEAADTVRQMVAATFAKPRQSIVAQVIGWVSLVIAAAGLFAALQDALNTVWHVQPPKKKLWTAIRDRIASFGMLLAIGFLLLVTTAINAIIAYIATYMQQVLPFGGAGIVFGAINLLVSIGVIGLLFGLMFKYLPDTDISWHDVIVGAIVTAIAFVIGQALIAFYLGHAGVASGYGAAGSLLVLLLWIYYSSMILLFGAEFTRVYAEHHGSRSQTGGANAAANTGAQQPAISPS